MSFIGLTSDFSFDSFMHWQYKTTRGSQLRKFRKKFSYNFQPHLLLFTKALISKNYFQFFSFSLKELFSGRTLFLKWNKKCCWVERQLIAESSRLDMQETNLKSIIQIKQRAAFKPKKIVSPKKEKRYISDVLCRQG